MGYAAPIVLERAAIGFVTGLLLLFASWFAPKTKSWLREWAFPFLGLAGVIICFGASAAVANVTVSVVTGYYGDGIVLVIVVTSASLSAAIYLTVICSQLIENAYRLTQGLRLKKLEWVKPSLPKKKH
jgi:hypothetical protein